MLIFIKIEVVVFGGLSKFSYLCKSNEHEYEDVQGDYSRQQEVQRLSKAEREL